MREDACVGTCACVRGHVCVCMRAGGWADGQADAPAARLPVVCVRVHACVCAVRMAMLQLRTTLEKLRPVDSKLKYQVSLSPPCRPA